METNSDQLATQLAIKTFEAWSGKNIPTEDVLKAVSFMHYTILDMCVEPGMRGVLAVEWAESAIASWESENNTMN